MTSNNATNVKKKTLKNPIKFNITLNEEQKIAKSIILKNHITLLRGSAGSGKTLTATQIGLDLLFRKEVDKIIITRPTVANDEDLGFLPGDIKEKMDPWLAPIYHNFYTLYKKDKIDKHLKDGDIEILPLAFIRGHTFVNSYIIVDEVQNVLDTQTEAILGRLGKGSKMVLCGDEGQIDLKRKKESGISFLKTIINEIDGFEGFKLEQNHRHEIVAPILEVYKKYRD